MKSNIAVIFGIIVICALCWMAGMINQQHIDKAELSHYPIHIHDTETKITNIRPPVGTVYIRTEKRYFYPGQIVTSKANGALILWDSLIHRKSMIVGIISDSGTIEHYQR